MRNYKKRILNINSFLLPKMKKKKVVTEKIIKFLVQVQFQYILVTAY